MMFYSIIMMNSTVWGSLLMSPLAENNGRTHALRQSVKKYNMFVLKVAKLTKPNQAEALEFAVAASALKHTINGEGGTI